MATSVLDAAVQAVFGKSARFWPDEQKAKAIREARLAEEAKQPQSPTLSPPADPLAALVSIFAPSKYDANAEQINELTQSIHDMGMGLPGVHVPGVHRAIEETPRLAGGRPAKYTPEEAKQLARDRSRVAMQKKRATDKAAKTEAKAQEPVVAPKEEPLSDAQKAQRKKDASYIMPSSPINKQPSYLLDEWLDAGGKVDQIGVDPKSERFTGVTTASRNMPTVESMMPPAERKLAQMRNTLRDQFGITGPVKFKDLPEAAQKYVMERASEWVNQRETEREEAGGKNTRYQKDQTTVPTSRVTSFDYDMGRQMADFTKGGVEHPSEAQIDAGQPASNISGLSGRKMTQQERQALSSIPKGTFNENYPRETKQFPGRSSYDLNGPEVVESDFPALEHFANRLVEFSNQMWEGIPSGQRAAKKPAYNYKDPSDAEAARKGLIFTGKPPKSQAEADGPNRSIEPITPAERTRMEARQKELLPIAQRFVEMINRQSVPRDVEKRIDKDIAVMVKSGASVPKIIEYIDAQEQLLAGRKESPVEKAIRQHKGR